MRRHLELVFVLLILAAIGAAFYHINTSFKDPSEVRDYLQSFGVFGPLIVILLIILEVIFAPIPGIIIAIGSGYAFGALRGTLYSYIGNVIGTMIAFWLSRHFGRPLAKKLIREEKLDYYDRFFRERGIYALWAAYLLPIFPTDIISFVTGLSSLRFRKFIRIVLIGFIPNMLILNYFGESILLRGFSLTTALIGSSLLLLGFIALLITHRRKLV